MFVTVTLRLLNVRVYVFTRTVEHLNQTTRDDGIEETATSHIHNSTT